MFIQGAFSSFALISKHLPSPSTSLPKCWMKYRHGMVILQPPLCKNAIAKGRPVFSDLNIFPWFWSALASDLPYRYAGSCCGCPVPCLVHAIYTKKFWSACRQFHAYNPLNLLAQKWPHHCMGWGKSEPMGKAYHSQCRHSHSVKQILDLTLCIQEWILLSISSQRESGCSPTGFFSVVLQIYGSVGSMPIQVSPMG